MKNLWLCILFLGSLSIGYSQNKYPFKYSFRYQETRHKIDTLLTSTNSGLLLKTTDLWGNAIPFVTIFINGDNLDTAFTNINGETMINIPAGKYTIKTRSMSHFEYTADIILNKIQSIEIQILLRPAVIYDIVSKKEMTNEEIEEIIDCYTRNKKPKCEKKKWYYIIPQI